MPQYKEGDIALKVKTCFLQMDMQEMERRVNFRYKSHVV